LILIINISKYILKYIILLQFKKIKKNMKETELKIKNEIVKIITGIGKELKSL